MKKSRSQSGFLCGDDVPLFVCSFLRLSPTRTDGGGGLSRRPFAQNNRCRDIKFPPKSLSPETFATFKSLLRRIMYGTKVTPQLFPAPSVKKIRPGGKSVSRRGMGCAFCTVSTTQFNDNNQWRLCIRYNAEICYIFT